MKKIILKVVCTIGLLALPLIAMDSELSIPDQNLLIGHYQRYQTASGQHKLGMNVHQFNATVNMRQMLIDLQKIDDQYIHSISDNPASLIAESILFSEEFEMLNEAGQQSVRLNLNRLMSHIKSTPIETAETGANIAILLSRIWSLSSFEEVRSPNNFFPSSAAARSFLLNVLRENSETGGGCYQGFAGRLGGLYLMLINSWVMK